MQRYREAAMAESQKDGRLSNDELRSLYATARLHEVLCLCTPVGNRLALLSRCIRFHPGL